MQVGINPHPPWSPAGVPQAMTLSILQHQFSDHISVVLIARSHDLQVGMTAHAVAEGTAPSWDVPEKDGM